MEWQPMETAPTDGSSVLLLIENDDFPLHDDSPSISIGSYGIEGGTEHDPTWNFAGWSWEHDCYCRGTGTPIGWMPRPLAKSPVVEDRSKLRFQYFYKNNKCTAKSATDKDCICWYDEGSGPQYKEKHSDDSPMVEWRLPPTNSTGG